MPERCPTVLRNSFWLERWEILTPTQLNSALLTWSLSKVSFKGIPGQRCRYLRGSSRTGSERKFVQEVIFLISAGCDLLNFKVLDDGAR